MLHIYRQLTALKQFKAVVFAQKLENVGAFPFSELRVIPKPWSHPLRRLWQKQILGLPLLEMSDIPVVVSFHGADVQVGLDKPSHRSRTLRMLELATLILVRSESLAQRLLDLGCPGEKIRLHRTGIPLESIGYTEHSVPPDGGWRCLQACRLIEKKGIKTSLRAFARFSVTYPKATLTIAGEGPQKSALLALVQELGLQQKVFFPGFLSQEELREEMKGAHLFLHPSQIGQNGDQEGVPNAMLEAMAAGIPPMATFHGGITEAVEHGVSGFLVEEGDHLALGQAMLDLAVDPARYALTSLHAAKRVAAQFDLRAQSLALESFYFQAINLYADKIGAGKNVTSLSDASGSTSMS